MEKPPLRQIFWIFAKVSACTIGGGYAMLPVFEEELARKRSWLPPEDMLTAMAVAQSCPGLIAVNVAVFAGIRMRGMPGALAAALGVVMAPFWAIVLLAGAAAALEGSQEFAAALSGVRAGVAALIFLAFLSLARKTLNGWGARALAAAAFAAMAVFRVNPVWLILAGLAAGILAGAFSAARGARTPEGN